MNIKSNEQILFEAYLALIGYDYCGSRIYLKKRWLSSPYYIAEINFHDEYQTDSKKGTITVNGYGYPKTVTAIVEQMKSIFKKDVELFFESDKPNKLDYCYYA